MDQFDMEILPKLKICVGKVFKNYLSSSKLTIGNQVESCTLSRSPSNQRNDNHPTTTFTREGVRMPEPAGDSMDNNLRLVYLTLDALKSFMPQSLTAVFPKLFESQWKTYEGQKKVS